MFKRNDNTSNTERLSAYRGTDGGFFFSLSICAVIIITLIYQFATLDSESNNYLAITVTLAVELSFVTLWYYYGRYRQIDSVAASRLKMPRAFWIFATSLAVLALFALGILIESGLIAFFDLIGYTPADISFDGGQYAYFAVVTIVLAPLGEELIFRGGVLHSLKGRGAVIISAALFALFHMTIEQTVYQFLLGIVLGIAVLRSGSLVPAFIGHALSNALAIARILVYNYAEGALPALEYTLFGVGGVALVALAAVFFARRSLFKAEPQDAQEHSEKEQDKQAQPQTMQRRMEFLSYLPGIGVAVVVWIMTLTAGLMG